MAQSISTYVLQTIHGNCRIILFQRVQHAEIAWVLISYLHECKPRFNRTKPRSLLWVNRPTVKLGHSSTVLVALKNTYLRKSFCSRHIDDDIASQSVDCCYKMNTHRRADRFL